jgi:hypothetical protein
MALEQKILFVAMEKIRQLGAGNLDEELSKIECL